MGGGKFFGILTLVLHILSHSIFWLCPSFEYDNELQEDRHRASGKRIAETYWAGPDKESYAESLNVCVKIGNHPVSKTLLCASY